MEVTAHEKIIEHYRFNFISFRSTGSGVFMSVGRVGAVLGNVTFGELVNVYCLIPMIIVAVLLSFSGLIAFKLPNTTKLDLL